MQWVWYGIERILVTMAGLYLLSLLGAFTGVGTIGVFLAALSIIFILDVAANGWSEASE